MGSNPQHPHHRPQTGCAGARRGVALLIVLGLLGLLLISAVGFAVLMRTERSAATNYRHTSSARHLLFAALNRAIEEIDQDIGDALNPDWEEGEVVVGPAGLTRTLNVPAGVLFSCYTNALAENETPVPARILTKDIMTYIPARFHRRLTEAKYDPPEWLPIRHGGSIVGRYAFAAIDSSGLLDASLVAATNRWMGASMGEVRLDPDILSVKDLKDVAQFESDRDAHGRYETIAELASLNRGIDPGKLSNFEVFSTFSTNRAPGADADLPVNLFGLDGVGKIAPLEVQIKKAFGKSNIPDDQVVPLWGINSIHHMLYPALIDYVDSDSVVHDFADGTGDERPCTEMLPLVNSFGITMEYKQKGPIPDPAGGFLYSHEIKGSIFVHFVDWPVFGSTAADGPFTIKGAVKVVNDAHNKTGPYVSQDGLIETLVYDYGLSPTGDGRTEIWYDALKINPKNPVTGGAGEGILVATDWSRTLDFEAPATKKNSQNAKFCFDMYVAVEVYNKNNVLCYQFPPTKPINQFRNDGDPGEAVEPDNWALLRVAFDFAEDKKQTFWVECIDPRFAFVFGGMHKGESQWYANRENGPGALGLPLLSAINGYNAPNEYSWLDSLQCKLLANRDVAADVGLDPMRLDGCRDPRLGQGATSFDPIPKQQRMYVANAPLQTPGELGYLLCGPWETVKLYDHWPDENTSNHNDVPPGEPGAVYNSMNDYHTVLDAFEVRNPAAEPKGKVNLNRASEDVLSLLFLEMPLRLEETGMNNPHTVPVKKGNGPFNYLPQILGRKLRQELDRKVAETGSPINRLSDLAAVYANPGGSPDPISAVVQSCGIGSEDSSIGEFEREAVIRNVCNLLTTKQQLFTIILRADAFTTRFGSHKLADGTVLSSANAVAQVFRDPVPTVEGGVTNHQVTVRMLKILE